MKKALTKLALHTVVLVVGSALAGALLLTLVYCIPTKTIERHVAASYDRMTARESSGERGVSAYIRRNRETFTDCIMMQYAFERIPEKNAFEHAMWAFHNDFSNTAGWLPEESLGAILKGEDTSQMYLREYSRYWHGYLVYLKPLLLLFTWGQLAAAEALLQLALMAVVCVVAFRRKQTAAAVAMLFACLFMKLPLMLVSPDMSVCWLIVMAALLVMLTKQDWLREQKFFPEYFLCVGILTSFFDFLTYPTVTLGFPLCVYFMSKEPEKLVESLKKLVGYSAMWGVGYAGMWSCKWIIAELTLRTGTIRNAVWTVIGITSGISGHGLTARIYGSFHAIDLNLQEYGTALYPALAALLALAIAVALARALRRRTPFSRICGIIAVYLVIAAIPFAWIVMAQYHSALHARFTFRIISVAVMAGCGMAASLWRAGANTEKETKA